MLLGHRFEILDGEPGVRVGAGGTGRFEALDAEVEEGGVGGDGVDGRLS
ncbi:hypothetical protein ACFV6F_08955 [Kitasatospora phosalacinea]